MPASKSFKMLILIAGVTGNLGHHLCRSALQRGHKVRGLGRAPEKLDSSLRERLESFVLCPDYQERSVYDTACKDVDAIVVAWAARAILVLDAQILLLRAAGGLGSSAFHAASWNADWSGLQLGDSYRQLRRHVVLQAARAADVPDSTLLYVRRCAGQHALLRPRRRKAGGRRRHVGA